MLASVAPLCRTKAIFLCVSSPHSLQALTDVVIKAEKERVILTEVLRDFVGLSVTVKFLRSLQAQLASFLRFITSPHRGTRSAAPSCSAVTTNSTKKLSHAY